MEVFFSCDPRSSACEWQSAVRDFTEEYNQLRRTDYRLSTCFDRKADDRPIPEVRLLAKSGLQMVVERKRIVWPENFLHMDSQWHELAGYLINALSNFFERPRSVTIFSRYLVGLSDKKVKQVGEMIIEQIKGGLRRGVVPCGVQGEMPWYVENGVFSAPAGVYMEVTDCYSSFKADPWQDLETLSRVQEETIRGFQKQLNKHLKNIERKFASYPDDRRVLLLQFIGESATLDKEISLPLIFQVMDHVNFVDEVWIATKDWVSEDDFQILWVPFWADSQGLSAKSSI